MIASAEKVLRNCCLMFVLFIYLISFVVLAFVDGATVSLLSYHDELAVIFGAIEVADLELPAHGRSEVEPVVECSHDPRVSVVTLADDEQLVGNRGITVNRGLFALLTHCRIAGGERCRSNPELRSENRARR